MAFGSDELGSGWCSPRDCEGVLNGLTEVVGDPAMLDTYIRAATGRAKSKLRMVWPDDNFPFTSPPDELRQAVATIATYEAASPKLLAAGAYETDEQLRRRAKDAREWLQEIADGDAYLDLPNLAQDYSEPAVASAPTGEFGFARRDA